MQGAGLGRGGSSPYFFLSHAHTPRHDSSGADPSVWVKKLFDGLCEHIMELTDLPMGTKVGFLDQGIQVGTRWTDELSANLARCKVFVPLYSPRYFRSKQCGREWWAFSQRQGDHRARGGGARDSAIIPALCTPVEPAHMPQVARDLQFNHAAFGRDYADEGFYGLTKLRCLRDEYERAVYRLAKQIVRVADGTSLDEGKFSRDYESLPAAFGSVEHPPEFDISVLACTRSDLPQGREPDYYGNRPHDWNPYHPESALPLGEHAADLVRTMGYKVNVLALDDNSRMLRQKKPKAPGLILLDRWALEATKNQDLMGKLCEEQRPWVSVMIPQYRYDIVPAEREQQLDELTYRTLIPRLADDAGHCAANGSIHDLDAFGSELQRAVASAVFSYWEHIETYPPEGPPIEPPRLRGPDLG
ncbi:TIR-like protein FxsC [Streptomyces europaeiscabiei]|uniref:TIR-like protein FxsC n=1 Tax=Streptomyces europaeiscabiei TaxID=146819 RepID=UPI0030E31E79